MTEQPEHIDPDIAESMRRLENSMRSSGRILPDHPKRVHRPLAPLPPVPGDDHVGHSTPSERDDIHVGSTQAEFQVHSAAHSQNQAILDHLRRYFGQWFNRKWLREHFGAEAVNSRMANIRALVSEHGLDVDQKSYRRRNGKLHSYYRLCRQEHSLRLHRQRKSKPTS